MNDNRINLLKVHSCQKTGIILREETDDWAILFDPKSDKAYCINPTGVYIWKNLTGNEAIESIANMIRKKFSNPPQSLEAHVIKFIEKLEKLGLIE